MLLSSQLTAYTTAEPAGDSGTNSDENETRDLEIGRVGYGISDEKRARLSNKV
jgi:hypothetical protein